MEKKLRPSFERVRTLLAEALTDILAEQLDDGRLTVRKLEKEGLDLATLKKKIWSDDLRLSELHEICYVLQVELYPLFRGHRAFGPQPGSPKRDIERDPRRTPKKLSIALGIETWGLGGIT